MRSPRTVRSSTSSSPTRRWRTTIRRTTSRQIATTPSAVAPSATAPTANAPRLSVPVARAPTATAPVAWAPGPSCLAVTRTRYAVQPGCHPVAGAEMCHRPTRARRPGRHPDPVKLNLHRLRDRERGAVAILIAITLGTGVLLGSSALVVDVGKLYVEREQLTSGADAAALAVAQACGAGKCNNASDGANQMHTARKYANVNAKDGHTAVTTLCGTWPGLPACPPQSKSVLGSCI